MALGYSIDWRPGRDPSVLAQSISHYGKLGEDKAAALGQDIAEQAEEYMQRRAPWNDVTGHARQSLAVNSRVEDSVVKVRFIHGATYGIYLETMQGGRYAIIVPTLREFISVLERGLKGMLD